jgi:GT2 family glycosyltransferase
MNIPIIIPTYQRPHVLLSNTLAFLNRIKYNQSDIFVVVGGTEEEYNEYLDVITSIYPNINVIVGDNWDALASQLNFIKSRTARRGTNCYHNG